MLKLSAASLERIYWRSHIPWWKRYQYSSYEVGVIPSEVAYLRLAARRRTVLGMPVFAQVVWDFTRMTRWLLNHAQNEGFV